MDDIDKKILSVLQDDAKISNLLLADKVGLSPSACLRRVQLLEKNKVIVGYSTLFDEKKLGWNSQILVVVTLSGQGASRLREFEEEVKKIPQVLACYLMGGSYDYLMRVVVKDIEDYEYLHRVYLSELPHVSSLQSNFAMREIIKRSNPVL